MGIGVPGMHYRANLMGGLLDIKPARDGGTVVVCTAPIAARRDSRRRKPAIR
jgi:signal transduction histidine kinase